MTSVTPMTSFQKITVEMPMMTPGVSTGETGDQIDRGRGPGDRSGPSRSPPRGPTGTDIATTPRPMMIEFRNPSIMARWFQQLYEPVEREAFQRIGLRIVRRVERRDAHHDQRAEQIAEEQQDVERRSWPCMTCFDLIGWSPRARP